MPLLELAAEAEARGFRSVFLNEHTHIPIDHPRSAFPRGGPIPERYKRFWDPFIALSFIAARTNLQIGTAISLIGEHDAIALAHATASLDLLSGGRLTLGVGYGWHREEFEDHGYPAEKRAEVVLDKLELIRAMWTQEEAEYPGKYVRLSRSWSWPKPAQKPHPPILLGARFSQRTVERIVRHADGWIPMGSSLDEHPAFVSELAELRRAWEQAGRDPAALQIILIQKCLPAEVFAQRLDQARSLGVNRVILRMADEPRDEALRMLDTVAPALG
jgi:probable F420-dependent oxidoreductase